MVSTPLRATDFPPAAEDAEFLYELANDTEDAPWMVMSDRQYWSITEFVTSLRDYRRAHGLPGYIASMLPIRYTERSSRGGKTRRKQIAPDVLLAFVPDHERSSYRLKAEGRPPAFVLEVVSPSSAQRDERDKVVAYDVLQVQEYALFTPGGVAGSTLKGYRRGASGRFMLWQPDPAGRLWSDVLELWLVVRNGRVRAETREGLLLPTQEEEREARERAEDATRRAEEARQQAAAARQQAEQIAREERAARERLEEEVARLRASQLGHDELPT